MQVKQVLDLLLDNESIAIQGKTFEPISMEEILWKTGERMYWMRNSEDLWISIDPESEEVIVFHDLDEEVDADADLAVYNGNDYECSYAGEGKVMDGTEELDRVSVRDYLGTDGRTLRTIAYIGGGESVNALGYMVPEEELTSIS
jgi:hypothetical protein